MDQNKEYSIYKDIQIRTGGEIYIGVVGPVRTGKSTFIKRFMDLLVLPFMEEGAEKTRAQDELPQSGGGKTITTTEPKFIPKNAAKIKLNGELSVKVRLVDCVGYMVDGATGHKENDTERMVKTPWYEQEIPFTKAAEIGTQKVIHDHSTIGIMVTTDGSIGELQRDAYLEAEERSITELKNIDKPFLVIVNSTKPNSPETLQTVKEIEEKYHISAIALNCEQMKTEDINHIMKEILYEFPVSKIEFYMPKWTFLLKADHPVKQELIQKVLEETKETYKIKDIIGKEIILTTQHCKRCYVEEIDLSDGTIKAVVDLKEECYYNMLSEMLNSPIQNEYQLLSILKEYAFYKQEYSQVACAMEQVKGKGYGVVIPMREEITLEKPQVIKHGNKYGVKIIAQSPSIHMIKANVLTEIAPIVGSKQQAEDLISYIEKNGSEIDSIWDTNIFGKTIEQLVNDGIQSKISMIGDESQEKLQETMQKIVNESSGGMICIII